MLFQNIVCDMAAILSRMKYNCICVEIALKFVHRISTKHSIIGSDNIMVPETYQAIIWTTFGIVCLNT